jgi:hypothetical protein
MKKAAFSAFALSLCLTGGTAWAQWVDITDPAELRDLMAGRQTTATTVNGQPWSSGTNTADGHGTATSVTGNNRAWNRDWLIKGFQVCFQDHLHGWEGIWNCRTYQRHQSEKGKYRSLMVEDPKLPPTPWPVQKILNIDVRPAPDFRRAMG